MDRVVRLGQLARRLDQLEADDLQATLLVALEDATDELALDAIGLDEDEGAFAHCDSLTVARADRARIDSW